MGSWGVLGPALLSLAGVVLGAGGSLFGQYLVSRVSARQLATQEAAAHRAELKEAVLKFLSVASQVEKRSIAGREGAPVEAELEGLVGELWLAQAEIDLAARTEALRGNAYRYAFRLAEAAGGELGQASGLREAQARFMDAAYDDMWPGRRREGTVPGPA
ncbi:hypothetical protein [Streptomyces violaceoruber]|uniref:hypothetical protein n=1 Tax=Streptomyces violaceoruber TaxID=1935 RepID=UPI001F276055|nr:hypothetical protein [Streptomyces violaceoruber]